MIEPNELLDFIKNRRSIRAYQSKMIPDEEIQMILEAGRWAPSASNRQPWEFIVIKDPKTKQKIANVTGYGWFIGEAPIAIAIVGKPYISHNWYIIDTSLVTMNMMLMAWSLGIGTCWIGSLNKEKAREILGLKHNDFLLTVLPFGYIEGGIPPRTYRKSQKELVKEI